MLHTAIRPVLARAARSVAGYAPAIDEAAADADPRHSFLRSAWFQAAGGQHPITLVVSGQDGRAAVALPTVAVGPRLLRFRAVPGSYWPFRSVPVAQSASDMDLEAALSQPALGRAWRLGPVNADDPAAARLIRVARQQGWRVLERRVATSFVLDIAAARAAGPWPRPSTLKKNRFHEKHLASHGALSWRFLSGEDWTPALFDALARIEKASWIGGDAAADAKFCDTRQRAIWEQCAADPVLADAMHVGVLEVGGAPAAFSFGIEAGRTRYCIATSYDRRFAKHSPGKLISYRTYMDATDRGITFLDDGAGDGGHKSVMGEMPGPEIMDYLFVRKASVAAVLRPFWR